MLFLKSSEHQIPNIIWHTSKLILPNQKSMFKALRYFQKIIKLPQKTNILQFNAQGILNYLKYYLKRIQYCFDLNLKQQKNDNMVIFYHSFINDGSSNDKRQIRLIMQKLDQKFNLFSRLDNFGVILGKIIQKKVKTRQQYKKRKFSSLIDDIILVTKIDRYKIDYSKFLSYFLLQLTNKFSFETGESFQQREVQIFQHQLEQFFNKKFIYLQQIFKQLKITEYELSMVFDKLSNFKQDSEQQIKNSLVALWLLLRYIINSNLKQLLILSISSTIANVVQKLHFLLYSKNVQNFKWIISIIDLVINNPIFQKSKSWFIVHLHTLQQIPIQSYQISKKQQQYFLAYLTDLYIKYVDSYGLNFRNYSMFMNKVKQHSQLIKFLSQNESLSLNHSSLDHGTNQNESINIKRNNKKMISEFNSISITKQKSRLIQCCNKFKSKLIEELLKCLDQFKYHQILLGLKCLKEKFIEQRNLLNKQLQSHPKQKYMKEDLENLYVSIIFKILFQISKVDNFLIKENLHAQLLINNLQVKIIQSLNLSSNVQINFNQLSEKLYHDEMKNKILKFNLSQYDYGISTIFKFYQKKLFIQSPTKIFILQKLNKMTKDLEISQQNQNFMKKIQENNNNNNRSYISLKIEQFFDNYLKFYPVHKNNVKFVKIFKCLINIIDKQQILIDIFSNVVYHSLKGSERLQVQTCKMLKMLYQIIFIQNSNSQNLIIPAQTSKKIFLFYQKLLQLDIQKHKILTAQLLQNYKSKNTSNQLIKTKSNPNQHQQNDRYRSIRLFFNLFIFDSKNHEQILNFGKYFYKVNRYNESICVLEHLNNLLQEQKIEKPQQANIKKLKNIQLVKQIKKYLIEAYSKFNDKFSEFKNHVKQKCFVKQNSISNQNNYFKLDYPKNKSLYEFQRVFSSKNKINYSQNSIIKQILSLISNKNTKHSYSPLSRTIQINITKVMQILIKLCKNPLQINNANQLKQFYYNLILGQLLYQIYIKINESKLQQRDIVQIQQDTQYIIDKAKSLQNNMNELKLSDQQQIIRYLQKIQIQNKTFDCSLIKKYYDCLIENQQYDKLLKYIKRLYGHLRLQQMQILQLQALLKYYFHKKKYQKVILTKQYIIQKINQQSYYNVDQRYTPRLKHLLNFADISRLNLISSVESIPSFTIVQFQQDFSQILRRQNQIELSNITIKLQRFNKIEIFYLLKKKNCKISVNGKEIQWKDQNIIEWVQEIRSYKSKDVKVSQMSVTGQDLDNYEYYNELKYKNCKYYEEFIRKLTNKVLSYFKLFRVIFDRLELHTDRKFIFFQRMEEFYHKFQIKLLSSSIKTDFFLYYFRFLFQKANMENLIKDNQRKNQILRFISMNVRYMKSHLVFAVKKLQKDPKCAKNQIIKLILQMIIVNNPSESCWILSFLYYFNYRREEDIRRQQMYSMNLNVDCNPAFQDIRKYIFTETKIPNYHIYFSLAQVFINWITQQNEAAKNKQYPFLQKDRCMKQINKFNDLLKYLTYKIPIFCSENLYIRKLALFYQLQSGKSSPFRIQFICEKIEEKDEFDQNSQGNKQQTTLIKKVFILKYNFSGSNPFRMQADTANFYTQIGVLDRDVTYSIFNLTKYIILIQCIENVQQLKKFIKQTSIKNKQKMEEIMLVKEKIAKRKIKTNRSTFIIDHVEQNPRLKISIFDNFYSQNIMIDFNFTRWWTRLNNYIRTFAYWSYFSYLTKLGDRHKENILINVRNGKLAHIDLEFNFGAGMKLKVKQLVPFRLSQAMISPLGVFKQNGLFYSYFREAMEKFQKNQENVWKALGYFTEQNRKIVKDSMNIKNRFLTIEQGVKKIFQLALDRDLNRQMFVGWQPQI